MPSWQKCSPARTGFPWAAGASCNLPDYSSGWARHRAFVDASRVLGASPARIVLRHILPNVYGVIIVYLTLTIPSIILYESFLSYLGLGVQAPQASLGSLIADGAERINSIRIYWWLIVYPGAALALTLLALNFVGDGLRDAWDPRSEKKD